MVTAFSCVFCSISSDGWIASRRSKVVTAFSMHTSSIHSFLHSFVHFMCILFSNSLLRSIQFGSFIIQSIMHSLHSISIPPLMHSYVHLFGRLLGSDDLLPTFIHSFVRSIVHTLCYLISSFFRSLFPSPSHSSFQSCIA